MTRLSHLDAHGRARMVDVSEKSTSTREAIAIGRITMAPETLALALAGAATKGDVIAVAELAGVMAAKRTAELIPLCHNILLTKVDVTIEAVDSGFEAKARVRSAGQTGVEMEALTAVSLACLTLYDMLKAVDRDMIIGPIRLSKKTGGRSSDWQAGEV